MNNEEISFVNIFLSYVVNNRYCPQCGSMMKEAKRRKGGSVTFLWFECIKANCEGQWLHSYANLPPGRLEQTVA